MTIRHITPASLFKIIFPALLVFAALPSSFAQGKIAFVSDRDGNNEIYIMNADGSNQTRVTDHPSDDIQPSLSPDGRKIVFSSNATGNNNIFIIDVDGSNRIRLTDSTSYDFSPVFSPDGTKIAFSTDRDGISRIYIMNVDGSNQGPISPDTSAAAYPSFSPDGSKILYASNRDGNFEIYRSEISGINQTRLTNDIGFDSQPIYNSDASKICFRSNRDGNDEIYIMNASGSGVTRLTQSSGFDFAPSFSPDGSKIAFTSDRGGPLQIYTMGIDGSNQVPLTSNGGSNSYPSWVNPLLAPPSLSNISLSSPITEGGTATLSGNMFSADATLPLSLSINWGDGSAVQIFNYPAGTTSFSETHEYADDNPTATASDLYTVNLALTTQRGTGPASASITVNNQPPNLLISLGSNTFPDGSPVLLNGTILDPGVLDTHTVTINWGDGTPATTLVGGVGATNFSSSHLYGSLGAYTITVNGSDDDGGTSPAISRLIGIVPLPTAGRIAFTSNFAGNNNIYLMNSNGTNAVSLTTNPASDAYPYFSNDGKRIVFVSDRDGNSEIYTMDSTGAFQTRLTNNAAQDVNPAFSPDGSKVVFSSNRDGNYEIYIMNSNGTNQTRLTTNALDDGQPTFSPDSTRIYFVRLAANQSDSHVWSMDINGASQTAITSGSFILNGQPRFSPNGQKIVFSSVRPFSGFTEPEIFVMDANGANQTRLTTSTGYDLEPVFSPDGTKIAFRSERNGNAEIYIMDANGANPQRITFDGPGFSNFAPSWASVPTVGVDIADDLAAEQGSALSVPILVTDTTGKAIISYDFTLNYDPSVLAPQAVAFDKTSTLSAGLTINAGISTPGKLVVSGFGSVPLTGAGTLLKLKFDVIGTAPTSSDLTLSPFMFNEGLPIADTTAGRVFVQGTIDGRVTYGTAGTTVGVPNVTLNAAGSPSTSITTAANGNYHLGGFGPGAYTVTPSKTGDTGGISALDASLISQFLVGATPLTANQQAAGEVSGNGTLTSFDAALIAQYVALLPNTGITGTWRFLPPSRDYASVGSLVNQDYSAILMGEVSGDWVTTFVGLASLSKSTADSKAIRTMPTEQLARTQPPTATLTLATLRVRLGQPFTVPISIKFSGSASQLAAYQFDVLFDPQVIQPEVTAVNTTGTLSSSFSVVTNPNTPGRLRVVVYGIGSISSNGTLINLVFRAVGRSGSASNLSFANLLLNEGTPAADGKSGKITIQK